MTRALEALGIELRPLIQTDELKERYHAAASVAHPDRTGGDSSVLSELNAARTALESVPARLRLLAQRVPATDSPAPAQAIDWDLSSRCGVLTNEVRSWSEKDRPTALQKALAHGEALVLQKRADLLTSELRLAGKRLEETLAALDRRWPNVGAKDLVALADEWVFWSRTKSALDDSLTLLRGG